MQPPSVPSSELRILVLYSQDGTDNAAADGHAEGAARELARSLAAHGHFVALQRVTLEGTGALGLRLEADRPDLVLHFCPEGSPLEVAVDQLLLKLDIPHLAVRSGSALSLSGPAGRAGELSFQALLDRIAARVSAAPLFIASPRTSSMQR